MFQYQAPQLIKNAAYPACSQYDAAANWKTGRPKDGA